MSSKSTVLTARVRPGGAWIRLTGRSAQTLRLLIDCGQRGFTSGDASQYGWARRTSAYVYKLRNLGFKISTTSEGQGDARVGRYRLEVDVEIRGDAASRTRWEYF